MAGSLPSSGGHPDKAMHIASKLLARALDRARADWLAGDPDAWARYTAGLARLERHYQQMGSLSRQYRAESERSTHRPHERIVR